MKNIVALLTLSSLLFNVNVQAEDKKTSSEPKEDQNIILVDEKYDGESIIRQFEYENSEEALYVFLEVPDSIKKEIEPKSKDSVKEVTKLLAHYYDEADNIVKLNELFLTYLPLDPNLGVKVSKKYEEKAATNLSSSLSYIESEPTVKIPENELDFLKETFGPLDIEKEIIPFDSKKELLEETAELAKDLKGNWFTNNILFIGIVGIVFLVLLSFVVFKRR